MNRLPPAAHRMLSASGIFNVHHVGHNKPLPLRYVHFLLRVPWRFFFPIAILHFLLANSVFACLYLLGDSAVTGVDSFIDAFFFSVQTVLTIGYGGMLPASLWGNLVVTVEAFSGLIATSMMTGLVFVRVLNPVAAITFSRIAVIGDDDGQRVFRFRVADQGQQSIAQAEMSVVLIRQREGGGGFTMHDLPLVRHTHPALALTWVATHPIGPDSPLFNVTAEALERDLSEILVTFVGIDNRSGQTIVARHSYVVSEIVWDTLLGRVISTDEEGKLVVDFKRFHEPI